jgi:hypothetical protein
MDGHFYQMASMRILWSFDGITIRIKPLQPHAALTAIVRVRNAVHRPSAIATDEKLPGFGKRGRSLQCPDALEAIPHERMNPLNGAHAIAEVEVSEAVGRDFIEMMRHINGST